jgi:hypothetical protein
MSQLRSIWCRRRQARSGGGRRIEGSGALPQNLVFGGIAFARPLMKSGIRQGTVNAFHDPCLQYGARSLMPSDRGLRESPSAIVRWQQERCTWHREFPRQRVAQRHDHSPGKGSSMTTARSGASALRWADLQLRKAPFARTANLLQPAQALCYCSITTASFIRKTFTTTGGRGTAAPGYQAATRESRVALVAVAVPRAVASQCGAVRRHRLGDSRQPTSRLYQLRRGSRSQYPRGLQ